MGKNINNNPDLIDETFFRLTIKDFVWKNSKWLWVCECDCGKIVTAQPSMVRNGKVKSCGCWHRDNVGTWSSKGRKNHPRLYRIWASMKSRCDTSSASCYKNYGGRGITYIPEWKSFDVFCDWAMSSGYSDNLTLERIDVDGNYEPNNCEWIPKSRQPYNSRTNVWVNYNGEKMILKDACALAEIPYSRVVARMNELGWSFEKAISTPKKKYRYS